MKKIGILGGTFNPIHNGHLILAETARQEYGLEQILLIPSGQSYMKNPGDILPGSVRLRMAQLAAQDNPYFAASDIEVVREGNSYTYETLTLLQEKEPDAVFYNIVGADTLFSMENWKYPEEIFKRSVTVAAVRDGWQDDRLKEKAASLAEKYRADIRFMPSLHIEISSTEIRRRCKENQSIRYLVPEALRIFLEQNDFYR